jgi:hypothetical protein
MEKKLDLTRMSTAELEDIKSALRDEEGGLISKGIDPMTMDHPNALEMRKPDYGKEKIIAPDYSEEALEKDFRKEELEEGPFLRKAHCKVRRSFWTGGFDSTALMLKRLKEGQRVRPVFIKHSTMLGKSEREMEAQQKIADRISDARPEWRERIQQVCVWDFEQVSELPALKMHWEVVLELASALGLSGQYACIRFCRDVFGWAKHPPISVAAVKYDELWYLLNIEERFQKDSVQKFFKGFDFPLIDKSKRDLWLEADDFEKSLLRMTWSCEGVKNGKSCIERGVPAGDRCFCCKGRIEEMDR